MAPHSVYDRWGFTHTHPIMLSIALVWATWLGGAREEKERERKKIVEDARREWEGKRESN